MNAAKLLRQKILDLAIRGKLTNREKGDEPAAALLARIAAEKQKLIAAKKIKKEKPLPPITDDEKPFDVPKDWIWSRLGDIGNWKAGATPSRHHSEYYLNGKIPWLKTGDLNDGYVTAIPEFITKAGLESTPAVINPAGTVLMAMYGATIGKLGILKLDAATNQACCACDLLGLVDGQYLFYYLLSQRERFRELGGGGAQPNISKDIIVRYPVPLPPLAEQHRIVSRVEELLAEVDKYSAAMDTLAFTSEMMEKKVLDLAIRGKLTKREKGDEPAAVLLARIAAEKQKLVAAKKIKKEKPLPPITEDEKPFDIPEGWEWCRLGEVLQKTESKLPSGQTFDYIDIDAINNKTNTIESPKHLLVKNAPSRASRDVKYGDTLFSMVRPYLRNIAFVEERFEDCIASTGFHVCRPNGAIAPAFLFKLMLSSYVVDGLNANMKGDNSPSINVGHIISFPIPLPPLAEQKRIVARVDELLAECRKMRGE